MINQAILLGRVGKKENKQLKNGGELTVISLATSKKWKDSTGLAQEQTTWHTVYCFSKLAEISNKYVHVGDLLFVQGEIQNKKIESGEKAGQYVYSIHANDIKFIPSAKKSDEKSNTIQEKKKSSYDFQDDELPLF